jgi:CheY-like chemotaxis protein
MMHAPNSPDCLSIMVVEDNQDFRDLLCEMLTMLNHSARSAASAEEALPQLRDGQFDVLISDVGLPGISGVELARTMHATQPSLKIILSSGYGESVGNKIGFKIDVLSKPYSMRQLSDVLTASPNR